MENISGDAVPHVLLLPSSSQLMALGQGCRDGGAGGSRGDGALLPRGCLISHGSVPRWLPQPLPERGRG